MKKIFALILALVLMPVMGLAQGADAVTYFHLEGIVTDVTENGILMNSVSDSYQGEVLVNTDEATTVEGIESLKDVTIGQYIFVTYNGKMTRSLPPQVYASKLSCHILEGNVTEVMDDSFLMQLANEQGPVIVHTQEGQPQVELGSHVIVYTNGIMAMSYPGQVTAMQLDVMLTCTTPPQGKTLPLTLIANPSTGYDWAIEWSMDGIAHLDGAYVQDDAQAGMAGVGGQYNYVITGDEAGEATLTLTYQRGEDIITTQTYKILVDGMLNVSITDISVGF